eukprot:3556854-Alexandrium_andersonii.AAC.1
MSKLAFGGAQGSAWLNREGATFWVQGSWGFLPRIPCAPASPGPIPQAHASQRRLAWAGVVLPASAGAGDRRPSALVIPTSCEKA